MEPLDQKPPFQNFEPISKEQAHSLLQKRNHPTTTKVVHAKRSKRQDNPTWMPTAKMALGAAGGMISTLGAGYFAYQYFGTKAISLSPEIIVPPADIIIPSTSILDQSGTALTAITIVGAAILTGMVIKAATERLMAKYKMKNDKAEPKNSSTIIKKTTDDNQSIQAAETKYTPKSSSTNILNNTNNLGEKQISIQPNEEVLLQNLEEAKSQTATNENMLLEECQIHLLNLNKQNLTLNNFQKGLIQSITTFMQEKICTQSLSGSMKEHFSLILKIFIVLLEIDKDSALAIAKKYISIPLKECQKIVKIALDHADLAVPLAIECANQSTQRKNPNNIAKNALIYFLNKSKILVLTQCEKIIEIAVTPFNPLKHDRQTYGPDKNQAVKTIKTIFEILREQKNYEMAAGLLEKCVAHKDQRLQIFFEYAYNKLRQESSEIANQLAENCKNTNNIDSLMPLKIVFK